MNFNEEVVNRLIRYRDILQKMKNLGFARVFSDNLADAIGISPSLVRKDFSLFNLSGNKRGGYQINNLLDGLRLIFGKDKKQKVVVVGCGKIGKALMKYKGFQKAGIRVVAGFDTDPDLLDSNLPVPIFHISELSKYVAKNKIQVAVLTVPEPFAQSALDLLVRANIRGVLNFAPTILKGSSTCIIQNINIEQELEKLFYQVQFSQGKTSN